MKSQNPIKSWRRNVLGVAVVVSVGATGYLLVDKDGTVRPAGQVPGGVERQPSAPEREVFLFGRGAPAGAPADHAAKAPLARSVHTILKLAGPVSGAPLTHGGENPDADKGRVATLAPINTAALSRVRAGDSIVLPGFSEADVLEGTVNMVQTDGGWIRIGGELKDGAGSFSMSANNSNGNEVSGRVLLPNLGLGYRILMDRETPVLVESRLSTLVCYPGANKEAAGATSDKVARRPVAAAVSVPQINTRPGAKGVIYVDFDGESITDPDWNFGRTINAAPTNLSAADFSGIIAASAQDFAQFDVTFTTDRAVYDAAGAGSRMRVIVTPTDTAAPGAGGVAYIDSWSGAGSAFKSDTVCWVFNQGVRGIAEALSHEVGHTLGLAHDGQRNGVEYYSGNGGNTTNPTSWAPIMGVGYYSSLVQWSKGEYVLANNTEDDLAIIAKPANRFGLIQSELPNGEKTLLLSGNTFQTTGLLRSQDSLDIYSFATTGGDFTATVQPDGLGSNLDARLELQDASGNTLQLADAPAAIGATLNKSLAAGTYRLLVRGAGTGVKPAGGYASGYSAYGSTGRYVLSGKMPGGVALPMFTSAKSISGSVGTPLSVPIGVTAGATVTVSSSVLPPGLSFDPQSLVLSGTPTQPTGAGIPGAADGPGLLRLVATNNSGSVTGDFVVTVLPNVLPLADAFPAGATLSTSPAAPWAGVNLERADGKTGTVARSGLIANNGKTSLSFDYTPPAGAARGGGSVMTFYWKASTEPLGNRNRSGDFVQCRVNGFLAGDVETGKALLLSGETGWVKQSVRLRATGPQKVEFIYAKDASLSVGQDRVWVYVSSIGQLPSITAQPASVQLKTGETSFSLTAAVSGADTLIWRRNFVTLQDGNSGSGSVISGASTARLTVSNAGGADVGSYWLEARNAFGSVITSPVSVVVAAPPVISQQPAAPVGLKLGDPLLLTAEVRSASRIRYRWIKDGVGTGWRNAESGTITFSVPQTKATSAGKYQLVVANAFGEVASNEVAAVFSSAAVTKRKL
jgi:hypothetical protein